MGVEGSNHQELNYNLDRKLNPELDNFLQDKVLQSAEAKALAEIFDANKKGIIDISKKNLADLRDAIVSNSTRGYITYDDKNLVREIANNDINGEKQINKQEKRNISNHFQNDLKTYAIPEYNSNIGINSSSFNSNTSNKIDNNERKSNFDMQDILDQAKLLSKTDVKALQLFLGFRKGKGVDGSFGKGTFKKYVEKNPLWEKVSLDDYLKSNERLIYGDKPLSSENEYRNKYTQFSNKLENSLGIPHGIVNSIVQKESTFGTDLNSSTGSKGIMQLTVRPFKDMKGDTENSTETDNIKVELYRDVFKKLDLDDLKNTEISNGVRFESTLSNEIWDNLSKLQDSSVSTKESMKIIREFKDLIKSNENTNKYTHTLNMIIGSVYYSYLYNRNSNESTNNEKIIKSLQDYNADKNHKIVYANLVYNNYLSEKDR